jgi:nitrite reductase/ring-hydroxylating ferredoxin subunit/uncharacterized protein YbjT (DUF2867 family)
MRIVVIRGSRHLGPGLVTALRLKGHGAVAASPGADFDPLTGEGLSGVLSGADVVVDLTEAPSFEDEADVQRFNTATCTLLEHEVAAGVTHHVVLTPVAAAHLSGSGYFRARLAQEQQIRHYPVPYSFVRATPFFEFLETIADLATKGSVVHVPRVPVQPVAADDVVRLAAAIAVGAPLNGAIEIGGPEPFPLDAAVRRVLGARNDPRTVIADPHGRYLGAEVDARALLASDEAELGEIRLDDWLQRTAAAPHADAGVRRDTAPLSEHEFRVSDVPPGSVRLIGDIAVFSVEGGLCATQAMCTHRAGPLSEGSVDGTTVTCPLHGAQFNIWTGAVLKGPAQDPLKTYRVIVDGDVCRVVTDKSRAVGGR